MKTYLIAIITLSFLFSCTNSSNNNDSINRTRKEAMDVAVKYVSDKFKESRADVATDGTVTVTDSQKNFVALSNKKIKYIIDPAKVIIGLIDGDNKEDAIITVSSYIDEYPQIPEHLIVISTDGKLALNRAIETDMRIIGLKDRLITAEIYTHSRNTPLHDCSVCKEVVKYQFNKGDLVIVK